MIIIFSPSIILLFFYSVDIINLFENIFVALIDVARGNVDSRLLQFKISFQTGINNSLLGVGHNYLFNSLLGITIHNSFLYQFASLGIAGFTIYCYIYLKSLLVPIKFIKTHDFSHSEHIIIVALLSILTAFCIELSLFRVISGREQWLIMYLILLYCSPMSSEVSKIEETLSKQHYRLTRTRISSTLE